jgi:gliding motility-associated-like protein
MELVEPLLSSHAYVADWTPVNLNNQNLKFERTFMNLYAGVYELGIRDAAGCEKTYSITINVDTAISIPNIFTPNGDGVNDVFYIRNLPTEAALVVTNRWGKEVFRSGAYQNDWNGGDTADGIYFFRLELPGEAITGWVEILRGQ